MKFCKECQNMLYLSLTDEEGLSLLYYCRHCGAKETHVQNETFIVRDRQNQNDASKIKHILNPYTKFDPTLPRVQIPCPNPKCDKRKTGEVLYIRYDTKNLKYLYLCSVCDTTWKT